MSFLMKNTFLGWSTAKATKSANHANGIIARLVFLLVRCFYSFGILYSCGQPYKQSAVQRRNVSLMKPNVPQSILVNIVQKSTCETNATNGLKAIKRLPISKGKKLESAI